MNLGGGGTLVSEFSSYFTSFWTLTPPPLFLIIHWTPSFIAHFCFKKENVKENDSLFKARWNHSVFYFSALSPILFSPYSNWSHSIQSTSSQYRFIRTFHNCLCNISNWIRSVRSRKKSFTFYKWYNGYYLIHTSQKYEISIQGV